MPAPILASKLYIPSPRPNLVLRPRLIEVLQEGLRRKLTLISAPAGFGKTTLLIEWIAQCERPAAWLSLDEGDNDLARFLAYLIAAIQTVESTVGQGALNAFQSLQPPQTETVLTALVNDLSSNRSAFLLILDDYHLVESEMVDRAVVFLLEHLPPGIHMVISTREDPALPLARLRARDQLTELRAKDLRFTPSEAANFLLQTMGLDLTSGDIAALEARTEGWIAGLQLAGVSMRGRTDSSEFIQAFTGSHQFVMDYLVEEVLHQQAEHVQSFLLGTSILERLSGPLCDAVLPGSHSGQETLEYLVRSNLLLVPLDDEGEWFRYHHLFADVLQTRLNRERSDEAVILHRRACAWFERNDLRPEAIRHALAGEDFEKAADLIEQERIAYGGTYFQNATWLDWVRALPDELVRSRPRLSIGLAWELLFLGELEAAEGPLKDAERLLEAIAGGRDGLQTQSTGRAGLDENETRSLRASLSIAQAFHAQARGDIVGTETYARQVLSLASETAHDTRGFASSLLGLACLTRGDLEHAYQHIADGMANLRKAGNLLFAMSGSYVLADIRIAQGRLSDAIRIYQQALQIVSERNGPVLQGTADLHVGLSELYYERGQVELAREHVQRSEELGKPAALPDWPYRLYLLQARFNEAGGDLDGALERLEQAERIFQRGPVPDARPVSALKTRVWIRQGRLGDSQAWAERRGLSARDDLSFPREFEHITLARMLIALYRSSRSKHALQEAIELLERLLKAAEEGKRSGSVIEILVVQALAREAQGQSNLALAALKRALKLAEPEGYVRVFIEEGKPMAGLLKKLADQGGSRLSTRSHRGNENLDEYVRTLLAAFETAEDDQAGPSGPQPLAEPLSTRELEVLELIAQGLSNREISERLFLALSTVKGHNLRIFGKLQVQRRTEAVARARELGLLKPER